MLIFGVLNNETIISGIPGSGKNVVATKIALNIIRKTNSIFRRLIRKIFHKEVWIINIIYTNSNFFIKKLKERKFKI